MQFQKSFNFGFNKIIKFLNQNLRNLQRMDLIIFLWRFAFFLQTTDLSRFARLSATSG